MARLKMIGPPPYRSIIELGIQRQYLRKYGGAFHNPDTFKQYQRLLKTAPEYTALDRLKYDYGNVYSPAVMWDELMTVNFLEQAPRLRVPVYFFEGRYDYNTPWELVREYYDQLDDPAGKQLIWFEHSAHSPNLEEPDRFAAEMLKVLMETRPPAR